MLNLEPAPLLGDSAFTVGLTDPPNDLSNVVASPQLPNSGILQWQGRFSHSPIEARYKISGELLNRQSSGQRYLFIAGALVGVAGAAIIWLLELISKMLLALRSAPATTTVTGSEESGPKPPEKHKTPARSTGRAKQADHPQGGPGGIKQPARKDKAEPAG